MTTVTLPLIPHRKNLVCISNFSTAYDSESPQVHSSSANLPISYNLRPRFHLGDYNEKTIQNNMPLKMHQKPVDDPAASSNLLTKSQKRDVRTESCQRTGTLQNSSDIHRNPYVHNTYTIFGHLVQPTAPWYLKRSKEIKKRYSLKKLQNGLSKHNHVNTVIESSVD